MIPFAPLGGERVARASSDAYVRRGLVRIPSQNLLVHIIIHLLARTGVVLTNDIPVGSIGFRNAQGFKLKSKCLQMDGQGQRI